MKKQYLHPVIMGFAMFLASGGCMPLIFAPPRLNLPIVETAQCPICLDKYVDIEEKVVLQFDCNQPAIHHCCLQCAASTLKQRLRENPPQRKECCPICRAPLKIYDPRVNNESCERIHHRYKPLPTAVQDELLTYLVQPNHEISNKPAPDTVERTCFTCKQEVARGKVVLELGCGHLVCLNDAVKALSENKEKCPVCNKGPLVILDPLQKNERGQIVLKYLHRIPTQEEAVVLKKIRSLGHIKVAQDHVPLNQRVPISPLTFIGRFVDVTTAEYRECLALLEHDHVDSLPANQGLNGEDGFAVHRASYITKLKERSDLYYRGDDLWYYHVAKDSHDVEPIGEHIHYGPVFNRLINGKSHSEIGLRSPLLYLFSFRPTSNISGFAAVANAAALQEQVDVQLPITFQETRSRAEAAIEKIKHSMNIIPEGTTFADRKNLEDAARKFNFNPGTLTLLNKQTIELLHNRLLKGEPHLQPRQFLKKLAQHKAMHILYNKGDADWILLSLVEINGTITIYLLDASNKPLSPDSDSITLLRYFDEIIKRGYSLPKVPLIDFLERHVDTAKPEYQECIDYLEHIDDIENRIKLNQQEGKEVASLVAEQSRVKDAYSATLKDRSNSYDRGDNFWYSQVAQSPHAVALIVNHPTHGLVFNQFTVNSSYDAMGLKRPFVHLLSFHPTKNIGRFAALANAAALQEQIDGRRPPKFESIRESAESNVKKIEVRISWIPGGADKACERDFVGAADTFKLQQDIFEIFDKATMSAHYARLLKGERVDHATQFLGKLTLHKVRHVLYNAGDAHWVLVSFVKEGDTVTIYLLDSLNRPLKPDSDVVSLLHYFDDVIGQRYDLEMVRSAPSKASFEGALKKLEPQLYIKLLKELVTDFVDASLDQKNLVSEKIALCAQEIRLNSHISSLPSQTGDFFAAQVKNSTQPWPQEFKALVAAYNTYVANKDLKKRNSSWKKYAVTGALIGVIACAGYYYWSQSAPEKKKTDPKVADDSNQMNRVELFLKQKFA